MEKKVKDIGKENIDRNTYISKSIIRDRNINSQKLILLLGV